MKPGAEYETFVYEKFKKCYVDFDVKKNDKILGKQSSLEREIDISISGKIGDSELLYIVSCKDRGKRPADVTILGEFSSVIIDVGAAKGFLICTSGFAKTNYAYAKSLGIELVTVEDINSSRWKVEIEIPFIYIKNDVRMDLGLHIIPNQALADKHINRNDLRVSGNDVNYVSLDGGQSIVRLTDLLNRKIESESIDISKTKRIEIDHPNLCLRISQIWVPVKLVFELEIVKKYYLKYIRPDEYSQIRDHLNNGVIPLSLRVKRLGFDFDESFVEIAEEELPKLTGFSFEVDEGIMPFETIHLHA